MSARTRAKGELRESLGLFLSRAAVPCCIHEKPLPMLGGIVAACLRKNELFPGVVTTTVLAQEHRKNGKRGAMGVQCEAPIGAGASFESHLRNGTTGLNSRWMVLHTKSRQEKAVARQLGAQGVSIYLPLVDRTRLVRGRKMRSQLPLFPGYLFLFGERDDGFAAISTKRVCRIIEVQDQDRFVEEIEQIAQALTAGAELDLYPFATEGQRCRITRGPFYGLEGVVLERKRLARLVLQVDILGQGAALEVDADFLEPV